LANHTTSILGVDTGGTFTDFVLYENGQIRTHKVLSTPHAPELAILLGMSELGVDAGQVRLVHGSTVATNALLEAKGVATLYIGNHGLTDVLTIGRQNRRDLYDLMPESNVPPVDASYCLGVGGRLDADGQLLEPFTADDVANIKEAIARLKPKAIAINLLFSWLDDTIEKKIEQLIPSDIFVSRSSAVLAEYREYERGIATWLNAWVGPIMFGYLSRLQLALGAAPVAVMQSTGGTIAAQQAAHSAVNLLLSGPAGGLKAASAIAQGRPVLTLDMGGTSTDVAMIDGDIRLTNEGYIGPFPVAVPMVDMFTIGAGGGSIAYLDEAGMLQVGPKSAGASPGPACYGNGGEWATVTDANVVLGRLPKTVTLAGGMLLDVSAAERAVGKLATQLNLRVEDTAQGIIDITNEHMAHALRVISVQRGVDPAEFSLMTFGGAGGLHVCALADAMAMSRAIVPLNAGVLSAFGLLVAAPSREKSKTINQCLANVSEQYIQCVADALIAAGRDELIAESIDPENLSVTLRVDCRYQGQSYTLPLCFESMVALEQQFHQQHHKTYGYQLAVAIELVNLRVSLVAPAADIQLPALAEASNMRQGHVGHVAIVGVQNVVPVFERLSLGAGQRITGPALITETVSTTYLEPEWLCEVGSEGHLLLEKKPG